MNKHKLIFYILAVSIVPILNSCYCSCDCYKDLGCTIMTATQNSNGQTIATKTYCSLTNYHTDTILLDSVSHFYAMYNSDSITVTQVDSIYETNQVGDLECDETDTYESSGHFCVCAK